MAVLDKIRSEIGFPMIITSGYRCPKHNEEVSSTGRTGPHTTGLAVDVKVSGENAYRLIESALRHGISGIGISQNGDWGKRFIHLDMLEDNRPRIWSY